MPGFYAPVVYKTDSFFINYILRGYISFIIKKNQISIDVTCDKRILYWRNMISLNNWKNSERSGQYPIYCIRPLRYIQRRKLPVSVSGI